MITRIAKARRQEEQRDPPLNPVTLHSISQRGALAVVLANGRPIEAGAEVAGTEFIRVA